MPYIQISLSKKLTDEEKRTLAAGVAALVPMLPGKPGDRAIVQIDDGRSLYRGGELASCAFTGAQRGACGERALKKNCPERTVLRLLKQRRGPRLHLLSR